MQRMKYFVVLAFLAIVASDAGLLGVSLLFHDVLGEAKIEMNEAVR